MNFDLPLESVDMHRAPSHGKAAKVSKVRIKQVPSFTHLTRDTSNSKTYRGPVITSKLRGSNSTKQSQR